MPVDTPRPQTTLLGATLLVLLALVAGCGHPGDGPAVEGDPVRGPVAVVTAPHAEELAPTLSADDETRLRHWIDAPDRDPDTDPAAVTVVVSGRPSAERVDLEPRRPNGEVEHGPRRAVLESARLAALGEVIDGDGATAGPPDLMRAIDTAARSGARTIVVLSAGLAPGGGWEPATTGWDVDPAVLVAGMRSRGTLPRAPEATLVVSGLGRVGGRQLELGVREQALLRADWRSVCTAVSGRPCVVDDGLRPARPALTTVPGPVVGIPRIESVTGPRGTTTVTIPGSVFFDPDSCRLVDADAARAALADTAERLSRGATVTVSGRTAPVGPGDGDALSLCRARAVAGLLGAAGAPASAIVGVTGDGAHADPPEASHDASGALDPTRLPALRRVVLTLHENQGSR